MIKIALTKGRIERTACDLLKKASFDVDAIINKKRALKVMTEDNIEFIFAKSNDVITFIEKGIVDIAVVGSDTLMENRYNDYYELLDLNVGNCYFALCGNPSYKGKNFTRRKIIATKYPNITYNYFNKIGQDIGIIKMEGSVELGPIIGLSDAIVDIVETGNTLKANGLEVIDKVCDVSTRLIVNKSSFKYKNNEILNFIKKIEEVI